MKNPIKTIKQWLSTILTTLVVLALFGIIFIKTDIVQPSPSFFLELSAVLTLTLMMKLWWYDYAEDKALNSEEVTTAKTTYFTMVDDAIEDVNDLDKYLVILNRENREHFINNKIGSRTPERMAKKTFWLCLLHPKYKKLSEEEIGVDLYNKLYFKVLRKADKLRPVKSEEIMALTDTQMLYDSKNYAKQHKRTYQIATTILSFCMTTLLVTMAFKEIMLNWANVFRYLTYLTSMTFTVAWTIMKGYKQTTDDTTDYLNRLKFIIDKYATYKEGIANGNDNN